MTKTRMLMEFIGSELSGGNEYEISAPRILVKDDIVIGPDDFERWIVQEVVFDYLDGFAFDPIVRVTLHKPS